MNAPASCEFTHARLERAESRRKRSSRAYVVAFGVPGAALLLAATEEDSKREKAGRDHLSAESSPSSC